MCKIGQILNTTCSMPGWCLYCSCGGEWVQWEPFLRRNSVLLEKSPTKKERKMGKMKRKAGEGERRKKGWLYKKSQAATEYKKLSANWWESPSQSYWSEESHVSQKQTALRVPATGWGAAHTAHGKCGFRVCLWGDFRKLQWRPLDNYTLQGDYYSCHSQEGVIQVQRETTLVSEHSDALGWMESLLKWHLT